MVTLEGKVVVITGASSGIGQATAEKLAALGAKVVLSARRIERLEETVLRINQAGMQAFPYSADVTSLEEMKALASITLERYGHIDVWINNAGLMPLSFMNKLKVDEWNRMVDVNIKGVLNGIAACLPAMEVQQAGHIINVSSVAGHRVGVAGAVYSGTKFAVRAITEGLRMELAPSNIRTTIISPGIVQTELQDSITDTDALEALRTRGTTQPLQPEDIAKAICYAIEQPEWASVNEIIIRPSAQIS